MRNFRFAYTSMITLTIVVSALFRIVLDRSGLQVTFCSGFAVLSSLFF